MRWFFALLVLVSLAACAAPVSKEAESRYDDTLGTVDESRLQLQERLSGASSPYASPVPRASDPPWLGSRSRRLHPGSRLWPELASLSFKLSVSSDVTRRDLLAEVERVVGYELEKAGVPWRVDFRLAQGVPGGPLYRGLIRFEGNIRELLESMKEPLGLLSWRGTDEGCSLGSGARRCVEFFDREMQEYRLNFPALLSGEEGESGGGDSGECGGRSFSGVPLSFCRQAEFFLARQDQGAEFDLDADSGRFSLYTVQGVHRRFGEFVGDFNKNRLVDVAVDFGVFTLSRTRSKELDFRVSVDEVEQETVTSGVTSNVSGSEEGGVPAPERRDAVKRVAKIGNGISIDLSDLKDVGAGLGADFIKGLQARKFYSSADYHRYFTLPNGGEKEAERTQRKTLRVGSQASTSGSGDSSTTVSGDTLREVRVGRELNVGVRLLTGDQVSLSWSYKSSANNANPEGNETSSVLEQSLSGENTLVGSVWTVLDSELVVSGNRDRSGPGASWVLLGGRRFDESDLAVTVVMARAYRVRSEDRIRSSRGSFERERAARAESRR